MATKQCNAPTCTDGVKNASETDIDCGGGTCAKCDVAKACKVGGDCGSGVCTDTGKGLQCQTPTNTDGVKNGTETGIDCGGVGNQPCADGQVCAVRTDCTSGYCKANVCTAAKPDDGIQDGDETDVDCGGAGGSKACADGLKCVAASDCTSLVCTGGICQVPTTSDNVKNGTETDVDCGGSSGVACAAGKVCAVGGDCTTGGCDYNFKCAIARSCSAHYGGDTCGLGGAGGQGAQNWDSCCTTIETPSSAPDAVGGKVYMDKYPTTSGRMRVFLESIGYDVRGWVQSARAAGKIPVVPLKVNGTTDGATSSLDAAWDPYLPTSFAGNNNADELADCQQGDTCTAANHECPASKVCLGNIQAGIYTSVFAHLGPTIFKNNAQSASGCFAGAPGTHSYRFPDGTANDGSPQFDQTVYDTKSLNCVDYLVGQAFCAWDGGRLETVQEWLAAWGSNTATPYTQITTQVPVRPLQRCSGTLTCTSNADCNTNTPYCNSGQCCIGTPTDPYGKGDKTYWGCRFPWALDASHPDCSLTWPATTSIEYSNYLYSYEYPKQAGSDYIVFLSPPGRTKGRGPLGHSDLIGTGYELAANLNYAADALDARSSWTGNGSWEVHNFQRSSWGNTPLTNKYGKLGMRCVKFAPTN